MDLLGEGHGADALMLAVSRRYQRDPAFHAEVYDSVSRVVAATPDATPAVVRSALEMGAATALFIRDWPEWPDHADAPNCWDCRDTGTETATGDPCSHEPTPTDEGGR